jgi:hypothetical protein
VIASYRGSTAIVFAIIKRGTNKGGGLIVVLILMKVIPSNIFSITANRGLIFLVLHKPLVPVVYLPLLVGIFSGLILLTLRGYLFNDRALLLRRPPYYLYLIPLINHFYLISIREFIVYFL